MKTTNSRSKGDGQKSLNPMTQIERSLIEALKKQEFEVYCSQTQRFNNGRKSIRLEIKKEYIKLHVTTASSKSVLQINGTIGQIEDFITKWVKNNDFRLLR